MICEERCRRRSKVGETMPLRSCALGHIVMDQTSRLRTSRSLHGANPTAARCLKAGPTRLTSRVPSLTLTAASPARNACSSLSCSSCVNALNEPASRTSQHTVADAGASGGAVAIDEEPTCTSAVATSCAAADALEASSDAAAADPSGWRGGESSHRSMRSAAAYTSRGYGGGVRSS